MLHKSRSRSQLQQQQAQQPYLRARFPSTVQGAEVVAGDTTPIGNPGATVVMKQEDRALTQPTKPTQGPTQTSSTQGRARRPTPTIWEAQMSIEVDAGRCPSLQYMPAQPATSPASTPMFLKLHVIHLLCCKALPFKRSPCLPLILLRPALLPANAPMLQPAEPGLAFEAMAHFTPCMAAMDSPKLAMLILVQHVRPGGWGQRSKGERGQ